VVPVLCVLFVRQQGVTREVPQGIDIEPTQTGAEPARMTGVALERNVSS
jgi:hypothetical protein